MVALEAAGPSAAEEELSQSAASKWDSWLGLSTPRSRKLECDKCVFQNRLDLSQRCCSVVTFMPCMFPM